MRDEGGFTLVEMLVTLIVLSILVTAFSLVFQTAITRSATLTEHATLESEGRALIDTVANELRQSSCNATTPPVVSASGTTLTFYTPDRATPYHLREVSYTLSGGKLSEQQVASTNTGDATTTSWTMPALSSGANVTKVGSVTTTYPFDFADVSSNDLSVNGAAVASGNLDDIAYVTLQLDLQPKGSHNVQPVHVQTTVTLRTLGSC
jgi:prepilin-type N-terminal cleavage/methylation domain-containing protein